MTTVHLPSAPHVAVQLRTWAWVLVGLSVLGAAAALGVSLWVLEMTGAVTTPAGTFGFQFEPVGLLLAAFAAGLVALAAPSGAVICATLAGRDGDMSARSALVAAQVALVLCCLLTGIAGLVVWGPVIYFVLRHERRRTAALP